MTRKNKQIMLCIFLNTIEEGMVIQDSTARHWVNNSFYFIGFLGKFYLGIQKYVKRPKPGSIFTQKGIAKCSLYNPKIGNLIYK